MLTNGALRIRLCLIEGDSGKLQFVLLLCRLHTCLVLSLAREVVTRSVNGSLHQRSCFHTAVPHRTLAKSLVESGAAACEPSAHECVSPDDV
jgi:hypothetical protein